MAILILEDKACSEFGGAEKSMFHYIQHLHELNETVVLVYGREGTWLDKSSIKYFKDSLKLDLSPIRVQKIGYFKTIVALKNFCEINKVTKIVTHTVHCFPLLRLLKILTNVTVITYFKWVVNHEDIGVLNNWGLKCIDFAFANSNYVLDYWSRKKLNCKIELLPNGLKCSNDLIPNKDFKEIENLLFIGRIYEGKGLLELIKVLSNFNDLKLIVCGFYSPETVHENQEYHKLIYTTINNLGLNDRIAFKGFTKKPLVYMQPSTLVVIPSIWPESSSRVLYEAMMTKTSVLASELGGMGEVLSDMSKYCLVKPDLDSLTLRINEFMKMKPQKRDEIASYLNIRFHDNYSMDITHNKLDKVVL